MGDGVSSNGGGTPHLLVFLAGSLASGRDATERIGGKVVSRLPSAVRCCVLVLWVVVKQKWIGIGRGWKGGKNCVGCGCGEKNFCYRKFFFVVGWWMMVGGCIGIMEKARG